LKNQGEIIHQLRLLTSQFSRFENRLNEIDEKLAENFDSTNEKTMLDVTFFIYFQILNLFNYILFILIIFKLSLLLKVLQKP
jgi:hypothetical protein